MLVPENLVCCGESRAMIPVYADWSDLEHMIVAVAQAIPNLELQEPERPMSFALADVQLQPANLPAGAAGFRRKDERDRENRHAQIREQICAEMSVKGSCSV
jgi:hypothetical protein